MVNIAMKTSHSSAMRVRRDAKYGHPTDYGQRVENGRSM